MLTLAILIDSISDIDTTESANPKPHIFPEAFGLHSLFIKNSGTCHLASAPDSCSQIPNFETDDQKNTSRPLTRSRKFSPLKEYQDLKSSRGRTIDKSRRRPSFLARLLNTAGPVNQSDL